MVMDGYGVVTSGHRWFLVVVGGNRCLCGGISWTVLSGNWWFQVVRGGYGLLWVVMGWQRLVLGGSGWFWAEIVGFGW